MKITDLSAEDQAILATQFPAELEKQAEEEMSTINELYSTGFDKIASEMADEMDKHEKEEKGEKGESEASKKLDDEHKKEAAARGAFIARGALDGLKKLGSDRHQDELHYVYPLVAEKLGMDLAKVKALAAAAKAKAKGAAGAAAAKGKAGVDAGKAHLKAHGKHMAGALAAGGAAGFAAGRSSK